MLTRASRLPLPYSSKATLTDAIGLTDSRVFKVDAGHSSVIFSIKYLDVSWYYGRFKTCSGEFLLDGSDVGKSFVNIEIPTDSLELNDEKRNRAMKGQSFLASKQFPTMTFKSTKVSGGTDGKFGIVGDLSFRGKTRSITLYATNTGSGSISPRFGFRSGFEGTFTIKRSEFGMSRFLREKMLGDDIRVIVSLQGAPKK